MKNIAIKTTSLCKHYKDKKAVDGIDLEIEEGEIFGILGPNGAGKTTLLKLLATLTPATSGEATVFGYDITSEGHEVRKLIGLTGQYASVDKELTAMENMMIFGRLNGLSRKQSKKRAEELLKQFSLYDVRNKRIKSFSGGMKRRADLAISLITKPKIIFLDEPTTGLDPRTRGEMWDVIRDLASNGSTIILTTQYLDEADNLADRIAIVDNGSIVSLGTSDQLKQSIGDTYFELSVDNENDIQKIVDLIEKQFKLSTTILPELNKVAVKVESTKQMTDILFSLTENKIELAEFAVRRPTLDEVFLEITGKEA